MQVTVKDWSPLLDRIVVKEVEPSEVQTKHGLILPAATVAENAAKVCKVITLGTGVSDNPFLCQEGDVVMCSKFAGTEVMLDGEIYLVIRNTDILMVKEVTNQFLYTMSQQETPKVKEQRNVYRVPVTQLAIREGFNKRYDYGEIESLKKSIYENGVKQPLRGYKQGEQYIITDGHRRFKALQLLVEEGNTDFEVSFITEPKGYTEKERVFDMLILNDGKPLTMLEEAEVISELIKLEVSDEEICATLGKSITHLHNLRLLLGASKKLKDNIRQGMVSSTAVLEMLRKTGGNNEEVGEIVGAAIEQNEGKPVAARHIKKVAPEVSPSRSAKFGLDELRQLQEKLENIPGNQNVASFEILTMLIRFGEGKVSLVELGEVFFLPEEN